MFKINPVYNFQIKKPEIKQIKKPYVFDPIMFKNSKKLNIFA